MDFLNRRIHLITGKGGVGRTTVATALALAAARRGRSVLLAEIGDPEGGYSAIGHKFAREHLTPEPQPLAPGLEGCHLWDATGHEGFLRTVIPGGPLIRAALRSKALHKFLIAAPSFHEMGVFYHLLMLLREKGNDGRPRHDMVIIDMPATGHTLALTGLPAILLDLLPTGPIAAALREGRAFLNDAEKAAAWVVTLPEQLPVTEALELLDGLAETSMPVGGVILNRFPVDPFTEPERRVLDELLRVRPMHGEMAFRHIENARRAQERLLGAVSVPVTTLPELPVNEAPCPSLARLLFDEIGGRR